MTDLAETLSGAIEGEVRFDDYTRHLFARDASMYSIMPLGVVFPRHSDDVVAAVRAAAAVGVPVVPRGAGTSLAGQTVGPGLVLDFSRYMNHILELDPVARTARVEVGVVQDQLNQAAAGHGLMFGPDTSTSNRATIGGMIGNNSAGSGSLTYGMTIDHVRSLDVVLADPAEVAKMRTVAEEIKNLVAEYGGVNSSEHGDGLARSEFNREIFGDSLYEAMRAVKRLFDPANVMNPGKIVDAPPMTENLRDSALPPAKPFQTRLQFEVVGGMRDAADRCMNIGLCRKSTTGVMCPSYIATKQEEHATRGRANALVKALSEPDPKAALGDERLHEVLDLCLMCKACKSECPMSVDMATLKAETLSHHHDQHGVPVRSRIFGSIRALNRLGSATAPLSNLPGKIKFLRRIMQRTVGIAAARPLPRFERRNLVRWHRKRDSSGPPTVTFLADSFTTYTEPHIGKAAIELLERAGWVVELASGGCCGRSSFSKGLIDDAKAKSGKLIASLAGGDTPIVGCEPSCLFTLRDETLAMMPDDPRARDVADRVKQVEELLTEAIDSGKLTLRADSWLAGRKILYHGHCHQKAEAGTAATMALLRRIPGVASGILAHAAPGTLWIDCSTIRPDVSVRLAEAGVAIPLGSAAAQLMGSLRQQGHGSLDHSALLLQVEQLSGRAPRGEP